jgi:DNA adenine methylase
MTTIYQYTAQTIKSPLNYIGGKAKLLNQLLPLFPKNIDNFVDLFAGGCNIGMNVNAHKIYCNDNLIYLIEMYRTFQATDLDTIIQHIAARIAQFELSLTNETGYKKLRLLYNQDKNPLDLFVLIAYSFNHQIRFNNSHEFNNPFGKDRSSFNATMRHNLERFIIRLKTTNTVFSANNFDNFDFSFLSANDFVYCDPPYLITTGTYNDGKRGFTGWNDTEERKLLQLLDNLHQKNIPFALSNVLLHKGQSNDILKDWLDKNPHYKVSYIAANYANANYQTLDRDKNASVEVLITNYTPPQKTTVTPTLF